MLGAESGGGWRAAAGQSGLARCAEGRADGPSLRLAVLPAPALMDVLGLE